MSPSLPDPNEEEGEWREKRESFSRFDKNPPKTPKLSKALKGSTPRKRRYRSPKLRDIWQKLKENRLLIALFFIIILLFAMIIVVLNLDYTINIEGDEGDTIIVEKEEFVEAIIFRTFEESDILTGDEISSQYNITGIYTKVNISDFRFLKDYDDLVNFTVDITFTTNISIDSNHFANKGFGLWNFQTSSYDYKSITITGNYSNSFDYTSDNYLNKSSHSETWIRCKFQTSNEQNDYSFNLILNITGYFSVDPTTFPVEFEVAVDPPIYPNGIKSLKDGRNYNPLYSNGYVIDGLQQTSGINTYLHWNGNFKPESERQIKYQDKTFVNETKYNERTGEWINRDNKTYIKYEVDAGSFKVEFTNTSNTIITSKFSFKQRPSEIGLYNWNTEVYEKKQDVSPAEDIIPDYQNKTLTYTEIFTNTDVRFESNGTHIKEIFINDATAFWNYPSGWNPSDTYLVIFTKLYDFEGVNLYDEDGEIITSKVINGILKLKSTEVGQDILAYLPLGQAWSNFTDGEYHYEPVKDRIIFRGGDIYHVGAIRYQFVRHAERIGELYIDPTWVIGSGGDAWNDCSFNQTMVNETTNYVQLYPNNSTGDIISPIREAKTQWIKIQYDGNLHGKTVDIYWNGSQNEIDWNMELVKANAIIKTNYSLPTSSHFGKWKLILHGTSSPFVSPEIYNVTVFNDPPNVDDFQYFKEIEIDATKVSGSGSHLNFPVLINISDSDLQSNAQSDGDDIAFANSTHWLDHEIELWNGTISNHLIAWVRIPSLSTSVNTTIYMYYGNTTMGSQQNPTGVWDKYYFAVFHFNEDPTGTVYDSTGYSNDMTSTDMESADFVDTQIGKGFNFDTGERLTSTGTITIEDFTFELWSDPEGHIGWEVLMNFDTDGITNYRYFAIDDADGIGYDGEGGLSTFGSGDVDTNEWQHFCITYDDVNMRGYLNGTQLGSPDAKTIAERTDDFEVASYNNGYEDFNGIMDEVRISNISRSGDWLSTQYNNHYSPSTFYSIGSEMQSIWFDYQNITDHKWNRDWNTLVNFTVYFDFETNITIDSNKYINECLRIWNFTAGAWDSDIFNYTITGNFTSNYTFTSKDYLNQTLDYFTHVRIGVFASDDNNSFSVDLTVIVSGYFQNATIYNPDEFVIGTNFNNNFTEWNNISYIYYDFEYHKNITYTFLFNTSWVDINYLVISFDITLNTTIDSSAYQNNATRIWDVTNQEWDAVENFTITKSDSFYFEVNPCSQYLTKLTNTTTYFKLALFMSNLDYDFSYIISIQVFAWYWEGV